MKILLITPKFPSSLLPLFNLQTSPFGGWIDGLIKNLENNKDININIAVFNKSKKDLVESQVVNDINCFYINYDKNAIKTFFDSNSFDIIHVIGIEHSYIKDIKDYLPYDKTLINITGIQYEYAKVYLSEYNKFSNNKSIFLLLNLKAQQYLIKNRGLIEKEVLNKAKYVVGRTDWDKQSVLSINNKLHYFKCNEILREQFYTYEKWNLNNSEPYSIFVSQGASPIKGTHMVLEIIKILKQNYPTIKCYIAGEDLTKSKSILTLLKSNYASFIKQLIHKYELEDNIIFTGFLNVDEMVQRMLKSHVFLMPSSIENSVNSLQEAMLLGVPSVSSLVGGVPSLIDKDSCLTYQFNDPFEAAGKIATIFKSNHVATFLSNKAIKRISMLADPIENTETMVDIYKEIMRQS